MDDLLQEFIAETRETLEALAGEIVAWEANPADRERLDAIFRFVHTVKGSCGFLNLPRLARLSHAAEDALATVRDGHRLADTALVNAVLAVVDRIGALVEAIDAGDSLDSADEDRLIAALTEPSDIVGTPVAVANPAATGGPSRPANRTIRLAVDLLDRMMGGMSDMVLARNELARRLRDGPVEPQVEAALERLSVTVADMRDAVTRTRMQRIEGLFGALPRIVRDTANDLDKKVALTIEGGDVELDREMIELLRDPITHMVRNSIDHGIEDVATRRAARKPETGALVVSARQSGNQIVVEIRDDGAGIDTSRLIAKALRVGLKQESEIAAMTEAQRLDLVFAPGLSSRDTVTAISGRGVGMDVVRANVEQIGGRVTLTNDPGRGLAVAIQVPLTLSIIATLIVGAGGQLFALPRSTVEEIVPLCGTAVRLDRIGGARIAMVRGERLPLVGLADLLGIAAPDATMLAIVTTREGRYALAIDTVTDAEDLVVKPAAPAVMAIGLFAGQTLPDSGLPMLLLDTAGMARHAALHLMPQAFAGEEVEEEAAPTLPALLFDDLDGCRRAIALAAIDRVERIAADAVRSAGGRLHLIDGNTLLPLHLVVAQPPPADVAVVLRLNDGERQLGYLIGEPFDIVAFPATLVPAEADAALIGVAMVEGEPVELVDAHALFARNSAATAAEAPLCLLHDDGDGWMSGFLRPTLEAAGYRCTTQLAPGERAAVALVLDGAPPPGLPTVRLARSAGENGPAIYRYDRPRLIEAVARHAVAGGAR